MPSRKRLRYYPEHMPANPLLWGDDDAATLRAYLDKNPRFLAELRARAPRMTKTETMEARAMSGSEIKGAEQIFAAIDKLAGQNPDPQESGFIEGAD